MNEVITDNRRYNSPQSFLKTIKEKDRLIARLRDENARLRLSLATFRKIEVDSTKNRIERVKQIINEFFMADMDSKTRLQNNVNARRVYFYWLRHNTSFSLKCMAATLGSHPDHSTVIHLLNSHSDLMETDRFYRNTTNDILAFIDVHAPLEK